MISSRYERVIRVILDKVKERLNMKNPRVKKPVSTLAQRLRAVDRRPLTEAEVSKLNRVFEEMDKTKKPEPEVAEPTRKKIARPPEAET